MINDIITSIFYLGLLIVLFWFCKFEIGPFLRKRNEIKSNEVKNKKFELFMNLSPEAVSESLDKYFEQYINRYITYKFISKKMIYIKQEDVEVMVKDITKLISIEISELYIFYISTMVNIDDDEDLIKYIHSKVMTMCVEAVTNYNSSMM